MIKLMILAPRRDDMSHAEFRRYVTQVHGPLVKSVTEVAADIHHYHYNFPISESRDVLFGHPTAAQLDIVTEAWFDSVAAQQRNMEHPRYLQIVRPDEHRFANGEKALMHYMRELAVIEGERTQLKVFYFRRRRAGLTREQFQQQWLERFSQLLAHNDFATQAFTGYIQNHAVSEGEHPNGMDEKYFDVIDEFFIRDLNAFASLARDETLMTAARRLEQELLSTSRTQAFVAETVLNIP